MIQGGGLIHLGGSTMWTSKNRGRYDRSRLRYPSDLTDDEWALVEPLIRPPSVAETGVMSSCARLSTA